MALDVFHALQDDFKGTGVGEFIFSPKLPTYMGIIIPQSKIFWTDGPLKDFLLYHT